MNFTADDICDFFFMRKPWPEECIKLMMKNKADYGQYIYKSPEIVGSEQAVLYISLQNETLTDAHTILYKGASKFIKEFTEKCKPMVEAKHGPFKKQSMLQRTRDDKQANMFANQLIYFLRRNFIKYGEFVPNAIGIDLVYLLAFPEAELDITNFGHSVNIKSIANNLRGFALYDVKHAAPEEIAQKTKNFHSTIEGHQTEGITLLCILIEYIRVTNPSNPLLLRFPLLKGNKIVIEPTADKRKKQIIDLLNESAKSESSIFVLDDISISKFVIAENLSELIEDLTPDDIKKARKTGQILNLSLHDTKTYMQQYLLTKNDPVVDMSDIEFI